MSYDQVLDWVGYMSPPGGLAVGKYSKWLKYEKCFKVDMMLENWPCCLWVVGLNPASTAGQQIFIIHCHLSTLLHTHSTT